MLQNIFSLFWYYFWLKIAIDLTFIMYVSGSWEMFFEVSYSNINLIYTYSWCNQRISENGEGSSHHIPCTYVPGRTYIIHSNNTLENLIYFMSISYNFISASLNRYNSSWSMNYCHSNERYNYVTISLIRTNKIRGVTHPFVRPSKCIITTYPIRTGRPIVLTVCDSADVRLTSQTWLKKIIDRMSLVSCHCNFRQWRRHYYACKKCCRHIIFMIPFSVRGPVALTTTQRQGFTTDIKARRFVV